MLDVISKVSAGEYCGGFNDDLVQDNICYEYIHGGFSFSEKSVEGIICLCCS